LGKVKKMPETIHILDGSRRLHRSIPMNAVRKLNSIRSVEVKLIFGIDVLLDELVEELFERNRNQVKYERLLDRINTIKGMRYINNDGKLVIVDADFYSNRANWCFGGFNGTEYGLGYILVSAARMKDEVMAEQIFQHELGHMFKAPHEGRSNSVEQLGLHCTNDLCTMQQKMTVRDALKYAHQIKDAGAPLYCPQCAADIKSYRPPLQR